MNIRDEKRRNVLKMLAVLGVSSAASTYSHAQAQRSEAAGDAVVFDNEKVRVIRHSAAPGQDIYGPMPSSAPRLALFMTDAKAKTRKAGKDSRIDYKEGALLWNAGEAGPAENAGTTETTIYLIEPKGSIVADSAVPAKGPKPDAGGKVMLDNDWVRVIEHAARPRMGVCGMGMHTHPPHLTVSISGGRVKIVEPGKEPVVLDVKAGSVFWDEGGPHAIQNLSSRNMQAFLIEFKRA